MVCPKCGYEWMERVENPKACPECKARITVTIVTHEEAKGKLCPYLAGLASEDRCRGEDCMAFIPRHITPASTDTAQITRGFCGMLGQPHK
jgi:hypothetical protein